MGLLDTAGRKLVEYGATKAIKKAKELIPSKPTTPETPSLTGGGVISDTSTDYKLTKQKEDYAGSLFDKASAFAPKVEGLFASTKNEGNLGAFVKESSTIPTTENVNADFEKYKFNGYSMFDIAKAEKLTKDISDIGTFKNTSAYQNIRTQLGETKFQDILSFRDNVAGIKDVYKNKDTGEYNRPWWDTIPSGAIKGTPFGSAIADKVTGGNFSNKETALDELERDTGMDTHRGIETAVSIGTTVGAYGAFGKLVDKVLISTKFPSQLAKVQSTLRESYVKNPLLFNLTSNSAQESIEYGVNKGLGNDNYSVTDFITGLVVGGAAAKAFGSKQFDSIFDNITQKDLTTIDSALAEAKKLNPEANKNELIDSIADTKLTNGFTFGQLKKSFIDAGGKAKETLDTTHEAITQFFQSSGSVISTKASKRFKDVVGQVNEKISKGSKETKGVINTQDISTFKSDVLGELQGKASITYDEMEEVISRKAKEYGLQLNKSNDKADMMDEAEEIILKSDSQISNLANPKTIDGFKSTYTNTTNTPINDIYKLQEEIDKLSSLKATGARLTKIEANEGAKKNILKEANVKSVSELEDKIYKINSDEVLRIAKENRVKGIIGKVTNAEKKVVRDNLIAETKRLEAEAERVIGKLSGVKSTSKKGDFARIIQFTQLKNGMEGGNYIGALKTFIKVNKAALKGDMATAVEAQGGKVFRPTNSQLKKLNIEQYAKDNGYDGYVTKVMNEGKLEDSYTSLNDNFKGIDATAYWSNAKQISKDRVRIDVDEAAKEASLQKEGKFTLAPDEDSGFLRKAARAIFLEKGVALSAVDSYNRTFARVFGEDSHIKKVLFDDVDAARVDWEGEKIAFNKEVLNGATYANLKDIQRQRKFMIAMTARQGGVSDRLTLANNIWIKDGVIYDDLKDTTFWKGVSKTPDGAVKLTDSQIDDIIKEVESDKLMQPLIRILDNKFNDVAGRINAMHYNDAGVLIPTEAKYFPIHYIDANYYQHGEEPKGMKQIFGTHVQQGFLNTRKGPPNGFSLNMDFPSFIKEFSNSQLYYLHMKNPIMRAKRMVRIGNQKGISEDIITFNKDKNSLEFNDIDDVTTGSPIFSPTMKRFNDRYIERIENRGVIPNSQFAPVRVLSNLGTWATIAWNPWSAIAQPFSIIDSLANTSVKNMGRGLFMLGRDFYKGNNREAFKYTGDLLARQTEHVQGTAKGFFSNQDLAAMSKQRWTDNILEKMNDVGLRMMKRMDGEVSYSVWHGYFYDFLEKEVKTQFPNLKIGNSIDDIKAQLNDDVWFNKAVNYANRNMNNVMGGSTAFTHGSPIQSVGALFKASTLIQKTFINRMLFLNHHLETGPLWKTIPTVVGVMAIQHGMETEREYWRQRYNEVIGSKKIDEKGSHLANIAGNNPSLTFDSYLSEAIQLGMKKSSEIVTGEDLEKLDEGQIIFARSVGKFIENTLWNPAGGYEISSMVAGVKKYYESDDKGNVIPDNRDTIAGREAIIKMLMPNFGRTMVDSAHKYIFDEPLWQTVEDNYQIGKITKDNPEFLKNISELDFAAQGKQAKIETEAYKASKAKSDENKSNKMDMVSIKKDIQKVTGKIVPTEEDFVNYISDNLDKFKGMEDSDIDSLYKSFGDEELKGTTDIYRPYRTTATNTTVIYNKFLKSYADKEDYEGLENMMNELESQLVIKNRKGFEKEILKIMANGE